MSIGDFIIATGFIQKIDQSGPISLKRSDSFAMKPTLVGHKQSYMGQRRKPHGLGTLVGLTDPTCRLGDPPGPPIGRREFSTDFED
jgi:hypothetical protein